MKGIAVIPAKRGSSFSTKTWVPAFAETTLLKAPMRLKDKTAIIVGAGQSPGSGMGNGRATALRFAQEGAKVMAVDRTLAEAGVPGYETGIWLGLMAPMGTPRPVLERLNAEIAKVLNAADVREGWTKQGAVPMSMSIEQFDKFLRDDIAKWATVVKATGMKVE